jgi:hypothetical protein
VVLDARDLRGGVDAERILLGQRVARVVELGEQRDRLLRISAQVHDPRLTGCARAAATRRLAARRRTLHAREADVVELDEVPTAQRVDLRARVVELQCALEEALGVVEVAGCGARAPRAGSACRRSRGAGRAPR